MKQGASHLQQNRPAEAIEELRKAVAQEPRSATAHMLLGQAYLQQGKVEMMAEAKAELLQALDLDPDLFWARFHLAKIYMDVGRLDKAKEELEQGLQVRSNVPHFLTLLGEVNRRLGNLEVSVELSRKALEADPTMTPAHYYLALTYIDQKKEDEASRELERAVASKYVIPEMYVTLGAIHAREKDYKTAEELFKKAISLDPSRPEGHLKLGELYRLRGDPDRAMRELELASPKGRPVLNSPYYQSLHADIAFERGRVFEDKKMSAQAIQAYLKALEINPNHGEARGRLAELYRKLGSR